MTKMSDPLKWVPSAAAIRQRLQETKELARKLGILLKTAERLEHGQGRDARQGAAHD